MQHLGGFLYAQASEKAQFDNPSLARVKAGECQQRILQQEQIGIAIWSEHDGLVQRYVLHTRAAFQISSACAVYEDAPHKLGRNCKKVSAILEAHAIALHQAQVSFIYQRGGLECDPGPLALHIVARQPPQFAVDDGGQFLQRDVISIAPLLEQHGDFALYWQIQDEALAATRFPWGLNYNPPANGGRPPAKKSHRPMIVLKDDPRLTR